MSKKSKTTAKDAGHFQRHFRKFHEGQTTAHPSYVFDEDGNVYEVISITRSPDTNHVDNIPLNKNPEPNNTEASYIRPTTIDIKKGVRNEKLKGWKFTEADKKKVQAVIDKDRKKH